MKRILCILVCVGAFVLPMFSAVTVNGFGRALYSLMATEDGKTLKTAAGVSWDAPARVGFGITGNFEFTGFHVDINADTNTMSGGDERKLWVNLCDGSLVITGGVLQDNTLRTDGCFGMFNWLRGGLGKAGEDLTFRRISVTGLGIAFRPVDALYITVGLPFPVHGAQDLVDTYGRIQAGLGYTINDLFTLKAGYFGDVKDTGEVATVTTLVDGDPVATAEVKKATVTGTANIGLDIRATPNLFLTAGIFTSNAFKDTTANIYVRHSLQPLVLHGIVCMEFAHSFGLGAGVGFDYLIGNGLQVQLDLRAQKILENNDRNFIALAGLSKGFGNGNIGIGFELSLNTPIATVGTGSFAHNMAFAVPVKLQYNF